MSRPRRTSVLVAEDHPLFRSALVDALKRRPDLELVGEAEDGRRALELARGLRPDVVLMDARLPALDGVEVLRSVVRDKLPTRVDRKSTRLNSSHSSTSYAVFCLKKKIVLLHSQ